MRRILVEAARRKHSLRHGGGRRRIDLDRAHRVLESSDDLLTVADALGLAQATTYRHWQFAGAWLRCELGDGAAG